MLYRCGACAAVLHDGGEPLVNDSCPSCGQGALRGVLGGGVPLSCVVLPVLSPCGGGVDSFLVEAGGGRVWVPLGEAVAVGSELVRLSAAALVENVASEAGGDDGRR